MIRNKHEASYHHGIYWLYEFMMVDVSNKCTNNCAIYNHNLQTSNMLINILISPQRKEVDLEPLKREIDGNCDNRSNQQQVSKFQQNKRQSFFLWRHGKFKDYRYTGIPNFWKNSCREDNWWLDKQTSRQAKTSGFRFYQQNVALMKLANGSIVVIYEPSLSRLLISYYLVNAEIFILFPLSAFEL